MFSAPQYIAWIIVLCGSVLLCIRLWSGAGEARLARLYCLAQIVYGVLLLPLSFVADKPLFYSAFVLVSIADSCLQLYILYQLALRLFGDAGGLLHPRYGAAAVVLVTTIVVAVSLVRSPEDYKTLESIWVQVGQIFSIARIVAVLTLACYGWIVESRWPRGVLLVWLGFVIECAADFAASRVDLLTNYRFHHPLQFSSTVAYLAALGCWWSIAARRVETSPAVLRHSFSEGHR